MANIPKYSIVIPVYNVQKTLNRCVDSILKQGYRDMEIILVNDGSSDDSGAICREYADRDDHVIYIEKVNGGVSTARNTGIDHAHGTYVLFVDSDDYVSENYFEALEQIDGEGKFDFVMFSNYFVNAATVSTRIMTPYVAEDADGSVKQFCEAFAKKHLNVPWNKRYVRRIIQENAIRFPENLYIGEDKVFSLEYAMHCRNCYVTDALLYWVDITNENSLSRKIRPDLYEQFEILTATIYEMIEKADIPAEHRAQYLAAQNLLQLRAVYSEAKRMHLTGKNRTWRRKVIKDMCESNNNQRAFLPGGMFSKLLQIPVRRKMASLIDLLGWYLAR